MQKYDRIPKSPALKKTCDFTIRRMQYALLPVWRENTLLAVVAGKAMDTRFDQNQSEFSVAILSVSLEMLSHADGLLDHEVEILWEFWSGAQRFQNSQDLGPCQVMRLADSVGVSQVHADKRRLVTFLGKLVDDVLDLFGRRFLPRGHRSSPC